MEQNNKIKRSEIWKKIYKIVKQIPRKEIVEDAPDAVSVASDLEELFLSLKPGHINSDSISGFRLDYCNKCFQMTNHIDSVCQKCKSKNY